MKYLKDDDVARWMKRADLDELRPEYRRDDFGPSVRGKYLEAFRSGTNLVLLHPDVAKAFPTDESVNKTLRSFMDAAEGLADTSPLTQTEAETRTRLPKKPR